MTTPSKAEEFWQMVRRKIPGAPKSIEDALKAPPARQPEPGPSGTDARRVRAVLERWGVPARQRDTVMRGLARSAPLESVKRFFYEGAQLGRWALVLSGQFGVGKSAAAGWYLAEWAKTQGLSADGLKPCWYSGFEIMQMGLYDRDNIDHIRRTRYLVIDDLGAEYCDAPGVFHALLYDVLSCRQANYRPTIITSNLAAEPFAKRYGERLIERFREGGWFAEAPKGARNFRRGSPS